MSTRRPILRLLAGAAICSTLLGLGLHPLAVRGQEKAVTFKPPRVEHNVTVAGMKGMYLYANFEFKGDRAAPATLAAFFHDEGVDGFAVEATKYTPAPYRTRDGKVFTQVSLTPSIDAANEWRLFIPYEAFTKFSGSTWDYKYFLRLNDNRDQHAYGRSAWYKVSVTTP